MEGVCENKIEVIYTPSPYMKHNDNTYNDSTYNGFTYNDNTYNS